VDEESYDVEVSFEANTRGTLPRQAQDFGQDANAHGIVSASWHASLATGGSSGKVGDSTVASVPSLVDCSVDFDEADDGDHDDAVSSVVLRLPDSSDEGKLGEVGEQGGSSRPCAGELMIKKEKIVGSCDKCGISFQQRSSYDKHMKTLGVDNK
jgi:hypothetical protein